MKPDCHFIEGKEEDAAPFSSPEKVRNISTHVFFFLFLIKTRKSDMIHHLESVLAIWPVPNSIA